MKIQYNNMYISCCDNGCRIGLCPLSNVACGRDQKHSINMPYYTYPLALKINMNTIDNDGNELNPFSFTPFYNPHSVSYHVSKHDQVLGGSLCLNIYAIPSVVQ